jgi:heptosyltransferase-2
MSPKKILIIQTAFIGDVVLATALVEKLHAHYPGARIDFLLRKGNEGLLRGHPFIGEVLVWDKTRDKYRNLFRMMRKIRANSYDLVVNLQRFAATGMLTAFSGAAETIGFDKNPWSFAFTKRIAHIVSTPEHPLHEVDRNQALIAHLTDGRPARPRLYPTAEDEEMVRPFKASPYVCIAPASVWFTKQYPAEQWVSFIRKLPAGLTVYLLGGPGDFGLCEEIRTTVKEGIGDRGWGIGDAEKGIGDTSPRSIAGRGWGIGNTGEGIVNLCGKLGFLASAALQRDARMSYVNDSAPMHFSSAVNGPVTAIYCSTLPSFGFGPLSDQSHIVEGTAPLACRPCGLHGRKACPEGHFNCARLVRDEQLLATLPAWSEPAAGN